MRNHARSIADVAEELMSEFDGVFPVSTVTAVVMRLSCNGAVSLSVLDSLARRELNALRVVAPGVGGEPEAVPS